MRAEPVAGLAQPRADLRHPLLVGRIAVDEVLEFEDGVPRLRLIAFGPPHLVEMHHPDLVLGERRPGMGGVEAEEVLELGQGAHVRLARTLLLVGLADAQARRRAVLALRIVVPDFHEVLARAAPVSFVEGRRPPFEQQAVRLHHADLRNIGAGRGAAGGGGEAEQDRQPRSPPPPSKRLGHAGAVAIPRACGWCAAGCHGRTGAVGGPERRRRAQRGRPGHAGAGGRKANVAAHGCIYASSLRTSGGSRAGLPPSSTDACTVRPTAVTVRSPARRTSYVNRTRTGDINSPRVRIVSSSS